MLVDAVSVTKSDGFSTYLIRINFEKYLADVAFDVEGVPPSSSSCPSIDGEPSDPPPSNLRSCVAATIPNGGKNIYFLGKVQSYYYFV